jgi:hypothetical protein
MLKWILRKYRGLLVLVRIRSTWAGDNKKIFTHHYAENYWGCGESRSGFGSTVDYTANIRRELPPLFARLGVKTLLDAPCGDYNWFRLIPRGPELTYLGGDIVDSIVQQNAEKYRGPTTSFRVIDITRDPLPAVDLWLCRDCLFHLSHRDLLQALKNFLASDITYLLTSLHPEIRANTDIATGSFRMLNLELPPYDFGPALCYIDDYIEGFPRRQLGLWTRKELRERLAKNSVVSASLGLD